MRTERSGSFLNVQDSGVWSRQTSRTSTRSILLSEAAIEEHPALVTSRCAVLAQICMLLVALPVYTAGPLLVNWAAVVHLPTEAEFSRVAAPARTTSSQSNDWYNVNVEHKPGGRTLFVTAVSDTGLAHGNGVLPGDTVSRGVQDGQIIFTSKDFKKDEGLRLMKEVMCYLNTPATGKLDCVLEVIDPTQALQVDFDMAHVDVSGGEPYLQVGIIFFRNLVGGVLLTLLSMACGVKFKPMLNCHTIWMLMFLGVGRAASDIFEIMANGKINAALYSIVSQTRLLGAAACARCMLGSKFTVLQISLLTSISVVIFCYIQVPDSVSVGHYWNGFGSPQDPNAIKEPEQDSSVGMIFAFVKTFLAVVMGVVGQKVLQDPSLKTYPMVALQAALFMVSTIPLLVVTVLYMFAVGWPYGFFGGPVVEFRHCMKDWDAAKCADIAPVALVEQGWDYRTWTVLIFYIFRESVVNSLVRMFSAIAKDLVNASATVLTYILSIALLGKEFNMAKCGLVLVVVFQVIQFTIAPKYGEAPKEEYVAPPPQPEKRKVAGREAGA